MTVTEMMAKAQECERLAGRLPNLVDRKLMFDTAEQWRTMARQVEALQEDDRRIRRRPDSQRYPQ